MQETISVRPERRNPQAATLEGSDGGAPVIAALMLNRIVSRQILSLNTVYHWLCNHVAGVWKTTDRKSCARYGSKLAKQNPSSDRPLSTRPMKLPMADRVPQRIVVPSNRRGNIEYLVASGGYCGSRHESWTSLHGGKRGKHAQNSPIRMFNC